MTSVVLINGQPSDGRIDVVDSSVLRGDGCFEVLKSYSGHPLFLDEHMDRLEKSAAKLRLPNPEREDLAEWITAAARECGDCAVRVVLTRGHAVPGATEVPLVIVFAHPWQHRSGAERLMPVFAPWHSEGLDWDLAGAKVLSYAPNLAASRRAKEEGFDDAILFGRSGAILEGPTFSVAWVVGGVLETPTLELGILDSITRKAVLEDARAAGITVIEGSWPLDRLGSASEVMSLSTIREVFPVAAVGDFEYQPGPVTSLLGERFAQRVIRLLSSQESGSA